MKTDAELVVGKNLTIPNQITNLHNDFSTFKPYAAGEIIGDTMPTLPDPPPPPQQQNGGGCGVLGQIIMIAVAIVATIYTIGLMTGPAATAGTTLGTTATASTTATGFSATMSAGANAMMAGISGISATGTLSIAGYAVAGAVGSIASQAVGIAIGAQDKFSWGQVAMGAIGSVAGGAAASIPGLAGVGNLTTEQLIGRAVAGNIIGQGVSVAAGLQDKFSWKNVAAAAVGAAVGSSIKGGLNNAFDDVFGEFGGRVARGTISGFAAGAAASIVSGGRMNVTQVATDAFGNALGDALVSELARGSQQTKKLAEQPTSAAQGTPTTERPRTTHSVVFNGGSIEAARAIEIHNSVFTTSTESASRQVDYEAREKLVDEPMRNLDGRPILDDMEPIRPMGRGMPGDVMFHKTSPQILDGRVNRLGQIDARGGIRSFETAYGRRFESLGPGMNEFQKGFAEFGDDIRKVPVNMLANTVEFIGNNLNLSLTLPGHMDYVPFMDWMKVPYNTQGGSYVEFGAGLFSAGALNRLPSSKPVGGITTLKPYSLTNEKTRIWYHEQLDAIPGRIDSTLPLRDQALQSFQLRNEVKLQARDLMFDRAAVAELPAPKTLPDVVRRAYEQGLRGDDVWLYVRDGATRSNTGVDAALGLTRK